MVWSGVMAQLLTFENFAPFPSEKKHYKTTNKVGSVSKRKIIQFLEQDKPQSEIKRAKSLCGYNEKKNCFDRFFVLVNL